uniref:MPN domain-containing protein n=1 Tax=Kalanchoe fedtschenkoi TaxID=63787 RepID=A0A7N0TEK7_KALFE
MEKSSRRRGGGGELPIVFYYRIADQLIDQAAAYRDDNNVDCLLHTLERFRRHYHALSQLRSYQMHGGKERLYCVEKYKAFMEQMESLTLCSKHDQSTSRNSNEQKGEVISFQIAEKRCLSPKKREQPSQNRITVNTVTQSSPSSLLSYVEKAPKGAYISRVTDDDGMPSSSNTLHDVHISSWLMEEFIELASQNTQNDLETCGVLGGSLRKGIFYATTLIIPKQESTSNSCQAMHEEEIFAIQHEHSLFPVGWIHTHPSQRCFMSSIDLHTHYPYQVMVPEAFAIVMAPTDTSRNFGIFRLTVPGGMAVIKECKEKEFHNHSEPADGEPIYVDCSNVYMNSHLRFEIFDLR